MWTGPVERIFVSVLSMLQRRRGNREPLAAQEGQCLLRRARRCPWCAHLSPSEELGERQRCPLQGSGDVSALEDGFAPSAPRQRRTRCYDGLSKPPQPWPNCGKGGGPWGPPAPKKGGAAGEG